MPRARLVFDGDGVYTEKEARIHKLTQETETKIDNIPGVVDDVNSTSTTDALSANMGKRLQDQINQLTGLNKFLSTWDCTTGLPVTDPSATPFTYTSGNYYLVATVAGEGGTNYKPHGNTFTPGVASTAVETNEVNVNDMYIFDGSQWILQVNKVKEIIVDDGLDPESTNAVENRAIYNALTTKQNNILDLANIRVGAALGATSIQPGDNITELTNNVGYQTAGDVAIAIEDAIEELAPEGVGTGVLTLQKNSTTLDTFSANAAQDKTINIPVPTTVAELSDSSNYATKEYVDDAVEDSKYVGPTAPSPAEEGMLWYDTTNDVLKVYDGTQWVLTGKVYSSGTGINVDNTNDTISNTGVLSVNGSTGAITGIATEQYVDNAIDEAVEDSKYVGPTAPSNPTEGMLWYDTTNDVLKVYDGTSWNPVDTDTTYSAGTNVQISANNEISATDTTYTAGYGLSSSGTTFSVDTSVIAKKSDVTNYKAGDGIIIGDDYSAMRGPCAGGYHIPSPNEWRKVSGTTSSILNAFGFTKQQALTYLHLPRAGYRSNDTGALGGEGGRSGYRTANHYTSGLCSYIRVDEATGLPGISEDGASAGYPIRPFKNKPVIPTNTWTLEYDGSSVAAGAGIYRNSDLGLISLSKDGTNWITIADKNLGATTTYNYGNTLNQANCGYFYQWGNNYGFPHSGTITTSSTKVDASSYGPDNYYFSSTFITNEESNGGWFITANPNLWGGQTGAISNSISVDANAIKNISVSGATLGAFFNACKAYGTEHTISTGMNKTYTMQGIGYIRIGSMYGMRLTINGLVVFSESFSSGNYTVKYHLGPYTLSKGDVVVVSDPGGGGSGGGTIYDYY